MKFIHLPFLLFALICSTVIKAQEDSLVHRMHQRADSILNSIGTGQTRQETGTDTPKVNNNQGTNAPAMANPNAAAQDKGQSNPNAAGWQNADSATRAKWRGSHARTGADSTGKSQNQAGNGNGQGKTGPGAAGGPPAGMAAMYQNMKMNIGHIYGKVIDGATKKPISYVGVTVLTMKDSLVTGQLTEDNGDFSFTDLRVGAYKVKVSFVGYKDVISNVVITPAKSELDIGNLVLTTDAKVMKVVEVTGQKSAVELKVDRKIFNVGADISARGGTGLDVMKNIPSVSIDAGGNVTLRNNTPQVYIDGKPTTLTLEQIPADQIDRVEVITNPSAKYEAASSGGIINVVMKKNTKPGYNGMINLNIATNTGYNGMAMLNLKEKKYGIQLMYTVNGATNRTYGYNNFSPLDSLNQAISNIYTNQGINSTFERIFQVGKVGIDYFVNNRNTLSLSETGVFGNFNTVDNISISNDYLGTQTSGTQVNSQLFHFRNYTTDLSFKHTYPTEGKEYSLDFRYNYSIGGGNYLYTNTGYDVNGNINTLNPTYETTVGGQISHQVTGQGDFSLPIGKNIKIETGFRSNYKLSFSYTDVTNQVTLNNMLTPPVYNYALSNNYRIDDLVDAAYLTFTHQIKDFSYQLGLRVEEVYYKGTSVLNSDSAFGYQYPTNLSSVPDMLFPSFNLSQKFGTKHEIQFNVARKSNRPNFFQIAPFIFSSTVNSVQKGNPDLTPEFINQGEFNYDLTLTKLSWLSSVYGRYTQQPITTYISLLPSDNQIFVNSYINGTHSIAGGWENTFKFYPAKKLDITLTGNIFYTDLTGSSGDNNISNQGWSWLAKAIVSYKLPGDVTVQVNGTYEAPKIVLQGKTIPLYYFDVSLSKDFGLFTLNFTVSDVMNTKASGTNISQPFVSDADPGFIQDTSRRRDQRYAKLGISFRFGKMDASLFKKKKPSQGGDQGGDISF